jgi:hypothetical protein
VQPFVESLFAAKDGSVFEVAAQPHSVLSAALSSVPAPTAARSSGALASIQCAALDHSALDTTAACSEGAARLIGASPVSASLSAVGLQSAHDAAAAAWTLSAAGSTPEVFYSSSAADRAFVHELFLLEALAQQLQTVGATAAAAVAPQLIIAHCSALSALSAEYGRSGAKVAAAQALLDTALAALLNTPYTVQTTAGTAATRPLRFTAQIISGQLLHTAAAAQPWEEVTGAVRHLASNSSNTTTGNATLVDITQYQLNLWTGVFFALLVFAAIYGVATMDIGRDSLLYAKFQADTTSKVD